MIKTNILFGCILFLFASGFSDPPEKKTWAHRIPPIAPFGGSPGEMANNPIIFDIAELQELLKNIGIAKPTTEKIVGIARDFLGTLDSRLIKVQREELTIREELLNEKPDLKVIQTSINKKAQIFSEIEFAQIKRDLEIKALLTRDEYEKWKYSAVKKMRQMMPPPPREPELGSQERR